MSQSPAKRRKTSGTTSIPTVQQTTEAITNSTPTTPTRASYLSPTKASLARSHPHLAAQNHARSLAEPRGRMLRDELLGEKVMKPTRTVEASAKSIPVLEKNDSARDTHLQNGAEEDEEETQLRLINSAQRPPLRQRQPTAAQARNRSESLEPITDEIVPRLVKSSEMPPRAVSRPRSNEPELPPTPVDLGLGSPPERSRGLSSSSPRGSKSGSGRNRIRRRDGKSVTSSPLKPKARPPTMHDLESEPDVAEDAIESRMPAPETSSHPQPDELKVKSNALRSLQNEVKNLKAQITAAERALNANELPSEIRATLLDSLKQGHSPVDSVNKDYEQGTTTKDGVPLFHHLFAPGNLQVDVNTTTRMIKDQAKVIHHFSVSAPSPWPSDIFNANFEITTDAEAVRVEKVTWIDVLKSRSVAVGIQDELHDWIQDRLKSELHRLDIGGLVWGLGEYFKATTERAKIFKSLARSYKTTLDDDQENNEENGEDDNKDPKTGAVTEDAALALARYLTISQLAFEANTAQNSNAAACTRRTRTTSPKIMAVWNLEPTWSGLIKSKCEVVLSGIPDSAHNEVTELFDRVRKAAGFEKAFEAVWNVVAKVDGMRASEERGLLDKGQGQGKEVAKSGGKKRKRFS